MNINHPNPIIRGVAELRALISANPFLSVLFVWLCTSGGVMAAAVDSLLGWSLFAAFNMLWAGAGRFAIRKIRRFSLVVVLSLSLAMLAPAQLHPDRAPQDLIGIDSFSNLLPLPSRPGFDHPEIQPALLGWFCVFAIAAGAAGGCYLNDFCKRHYSKPSTNKPPEEVRASGGGDDDWVLTGPATPSSCYCGGENDFAPLFDGDPGPTQEEQPFLQLSISTFEENEQLQAIIAPSGFAENITREEFTELLARMNLPFRSAFETHATLNGQPAEPAMLPATWFNWTLMLTNGAFAGANAYAKVTLEVSSELGGPGMMLHSYVAPIGFQWAVTVPHPRGAQGFYRAKVETFQP